MPLMIDVNSNRPVGTWPAVALLAAVLACTVIATWPRAPEKPAYQPAGVDGVVQLTLNSERSVRHAILRAVHSPPPPNECPADTRW